MYVIHMHTGERKKREKEERRIAIIDAAERLFSWKGYDGVTMEEVSREAQLATGTLYLYFENKDTLYVSVAMRAVDIFGAMLEEAMNSKTKGLDKAYAGGLAFYEFAKKYPVYFRMIMDAEPRYDSGRVGGSIRDEFSLKKFRTWQITVDAIKTGITDSTIRPDADPEMTAMLLTETTKAMIMTPLAALAKKDGIPRTQDDIVYYTIDSLKRAIEHKG